MSLALGLLALPASAAQTPSGRKPSTPASATAPAPTPATPPGTSSAPAESRAGRSADGKSQPVTVDADRMERFGKEGLVIFTGSVVARQNGSVQYADRMEVYFDERGDRILRTVSTGSVKIITRDCRTGTARRAEYFDLEQRLVLSGGARVWQDENVVTGETITIFLSEDRTVVQGNKQDRVSGVFHPRDEKTVAEESARKKEAAAKATCVN